MALLSGEVSLMFSSPAPAIPLIKSGKLNALAAGSGQRSPLFPGLPTIAESGVPGYDVTTWYGMAVPAGTAREIIARLRTETMRVLELADVKQLLAADSYEARTSTSEEYAAFTRREVDKWSKVIKSAGIKPD